MEDVDTRRRIFRHLNLNKIFKNSILEKVACIWHIEWVQIDAIKFERTQVHFLSTFSLPSSSSLLKVPIVRSAFQCCLWFKVLFYTADPDLDHEMAFFFNAVLSKLSLQTLFAEHAICCSKSRSSMHAHIAAIVTWLDCAWKLHFESPPKKDSRDRLVYGLLKIIVKAK